MLRFVHHFNYPSGVSRDDSEAWHLGAHVPRVRQLPGVVRYRSWRQVDVGIPYPSAGAPTPHKQFVRRTEPVLAPADGLQSWGGDLYASMTLQLWWPKEMPEMRDYPISQRTA